jgi:polar amino acid transport system substrate-binding protein
MKGVKAVSVLFIFVLLVTACSAAPSPTPAPTAPVVTAPTTAPVVAPTTPAAAPTIPEAAPTTAAAAPTAPAASAITLPDGATAYKGKLQICTDFPYPPQEFYDENGDPQGLDIEIGTEIANRLGLKVVFVNSVFDTIIAAVTGGKCDIIISAQNVTTDRQKQVSMIPYFQAGQAFVAVKGNPDNINTALDICGKNAAVESGTTEAAYLQGTGDYAGKGLTQQCTKAGKAAINVVVTQKDTDALQQLQAGKVVVYATDSPVAAYYTVQHPDQFQLVGDVLEPAVEGISIPCGQADCTDAPLTPLGEGVKAALKSMMADGAYTKILTKWNLANSAVPAIQ